MQHFCNKKITYVSSPSSSSDSADDSAFSFGRSFSNSRSLQNQSLAGHYWVRSGHLPPHSAHWRSRRTAFLFSTDGFTILIGCWYHWKNRAGFYFFKVFLQNNNMNPAWSKIRKITIEINTLTSVEYITRRLFGFELGHFLPWISLRQLIADSISLY